MLVAEDATRGRIAQKLRVEQFAKKRLVVAALVLLCAARPARAELTQSAVPSSVSSLSVETRTLPSANLGPENPIPVIIRPMALQRSVYADDSVSEQDREHLGWGRPPWILPYRIQDGFDRVRHPRDFQVVVLENEHLKATFFPELGGRLWSLVDKASGRELLSSNPVFQPCNLGLRTAWISGGVEWNLGWTGHWPYTCSPLFAARHTLPDGTPALRMWEWERVRKMPLQIDAWLPADSPVLFVRIAIRNTSDEMKPIYWWSNIAVEEHPDKRVLVSADEALLHSNVDYALTCVTLPFDGEEELTYPGRLRNSRDCFFRVPDEGQPWIAALDADGRGLFQTSTARLRGRKLFRWGVQTGGQNWQRFLGTPTYIEIQAGLARTQAHHLPMPPKTTWSWVEAYGQLEADPAAVHSDDWQHARTTAATAVKGVITDDRLEAILQESEVWANIPANDLISQGSGWGALEERWRAAEGLPALDLPGVFFPESSLTAEQAPWHTLLQTGVLPEVADPTAEPGSFVSHDEWMERLERSLTFPDGRHWNALFHLGLLYWQAGRVNDATQAWNESFEATENPWARRCFGMVETLRGHRTEAVPHMRQAFTMRPDLRQLVLEYLFALLGDRQSDTALEIIGNLPPALRHDGRIRLVEGRILLRRGEFEAVERLIETTEPADDMREGESGLSDLWFDLQVFRRAKEEDRRVDDDLRQEINRTMRPPARIDYRMRE